MKVQKLASSSWKFRDCSGTAWLPAMVPGCVHTDLLAAKAIPDPFWGTNELRLQWIEERDWEYRAEFVVRPGMLAERFVELVADGLDTVATVVLNGREVARTENMFIGHRWQVKPLLVLGRNTISVRFGSAMKYIRTHRTSHLPREINDPVGGCTRIRKEQCQFGWDWGPRFVTAGIWRDIRLEAWSGNRLEGIEVTQVHGRSGSVTLLLAPELARGDKGSTCRWKLSLGKRTVSKGEGKRIKVRSPRLWWPSGQGEQPLYTLSVEVVASNGSVVGQWEKKIGLRTIDLDRHKDKWGESFQFVVNGRAVFAKGANWIPAHSFVTTLDRARTERDLKAAVAANMNMVRVWGGGIYESEEFYDACDELGLLVWQDFMFACTLYPADPDFIASSVAEAGYQVRRLRHRASLALWCGNNEVWGINAHELVDPKKKALRRDHDLLFHKALPAVVRRVGGVTPYWPSSPWRAGPDVTHKGGTERGDSHFWDVWHGRNPVKDYEKWDFRFASEFGMQSFSSPATQDTFCPKSDSNIFGSSMENHQKNKGGNQVVLDYISRRYRFPADQGSLIYLSQLNQVDCVQTGVAHYRRLMPRCMGALYWQLNDCWPVASWSSIEFTGRWKALHHVARRFFAPAAVSVHIPGDEVFGISNYRKSTVRLAHVYTSYDGPKPATGILRWDLFHLDGRKLVSGSKKVALRPMQGTRQQTLDLKEAMAAHGRENIYLRVALDVDGSRVSEDTVLLTLPKFMDLPKPRTKAVIRAKGRHNAVVEFTSPVFQHRFAFDFAGLSFTCSDNFFDLQPGERKSVDLRFAHPVTHAGLKRALAHLSLADTY